MNAEEWEAGSPEASGAAAAFEVMATGPLALLQDAGRPGYAHLGVTTSGAADRSAYAAANRLVGNEPGAAAIEAVFGGLELRASRTLLVALTGASAVATVTEFARKGRHSAGAEETDARANEARSRIPHPAGTSFVVFAGDTIALGAPEEGLRSYLAVRGGFAGERVLGSRSTDVLSSLGPAPLQQGDVLGLAGDERGAPGDWPETTLIPPPLPRTGPAILSITRGPRDDWFGEAGWRMLLHARWTVGTDSNRVGVRLDGADGDDGAAVERAPDHAGELPSEGMVVGAVQIPPSGQPVVFLRDHPVTGGYPVIGVLTTASVDRAAQLRPGDVLRFRAAC
ncbi:biotin-dependent carboxyltransferase family protein [Herbiconiux sp. CPCC 205763]|uniref:Biotin-dependent carboxyltransferase family protein n=1 Tax=Herbiconiux aconitum TaxID=2970913 RepID=A0ABT2GTA5_9MICO|nr:biotin-dependent carboxyltransferase family protein [Herbiconiux aconitum]MCS5719457.1 biotin-dependent carboxyltransferase family protein [Herbiconiux aconitum]